MTISLDSITLNPDMVWEEQFTSQSVVQSVKPLLGGSPVVFAGSTPKGHAFSLTAREVNGSLIGILRKSVVDDVLALAAVVGGQYVLTYNGTDYTVIILSVEMAPIVAKVSYSDNDLMRGSLKFMTV
jgi:hypothetical protein